MANVDGLLQLLQQDKDASKKTARMLSHSVVYIVAFGPVGYYYYATIQPEEVHDFLRGCRTAKDEADRRTGHQSLCRPRAPAACGLGILTLQIKVFQPSLTFPMQFSFLFSPK